MTTIKKLALAFLALSVVGAPVGAAFAQGSMTETQESGEASDMKASLGAKVQLSEAIAAAEAAVGGKAVDSGFEEEGTSPAWEVEVAKADGTSATVLVDAATGKVDQNTKADRETKEDGEGGENGEEAN